MSDLSELNSDAFNSTLDIRTLSIRDVLGTGLKLSDSESENMLNKHGKHVQLVPHVQNV